MNWKDILKFNPFKARQKRKEEELQREKDRQQRIADDQKRRRQRMNELSNMTDEQFNQRMAEGDISEERKKKIDDHFGIKQ